MVCIINTFLPFSTIKEISVTEKQDVVLKQGITKKAHLHSITCTLKVCPLSPLNHHDHKASYIASRALQNMNSTKYTFSNIEGFRTPTPLYVVKQKKIVTVLGDIYKKKKIASNWP